MAPSTTRGLRKRRFRREASSPSSFVGGWLAVVGFLTLVVIMVVANLSFVRFYYQHQQTQQQSTSNHIHPGQLINVDRIPPKNDEESHSHRHSEQQQQQPDNGRAHVVRLLQDEAGVSSLTPELVAQLPTWQQVVDTYGSRPRLLFGNNDNRHDNNNTVCRQFQQTVPPLRRMVGAAGMFSTGTNLVTSLLKNNCQIPERVQFYGVNATKEQHGMRWQVPWGKHTQQQYRNAHSTQLAKDIRKDDLLPIVTIRHPLYWMKSMCKNPYTARWKHTKANCPNLADDDKNWNNLTVKYGAGTQDYASLAHLYNDWYHGYTQHASYPWIMIRMEDLIFHTYDTIHQVCECAGGQLVSDNNSNETARRQLQYPLDSAKADSPGHDTSTGLVQAWIKYSRAPDVSSWTRTDIQAAREILDADLLDVFGYQLPTMT